MIYFDLIIYFKSLNVETKIIIIQIVFIILEIISIGYINHITKDI